MGRWIPSLPAVPWDEDGERPQHDDPVIPEVWEFDPEEPVGYLLDARGDVAVTVMPERVPFGYQVRNPHDRP